MAESRLRRLQQLFDAALELDPASQDAYAREQCAEDPALLEELLRLLRRQREQRVLPDASALPGLDAVLRDALQGDPREGSEVGPWRLVELIGDGGMGRVYRARRVDGEVEQQVAIKLIRAEAVHPALLSRFSAERRVLAALDHPNICRFLDAGALPDGTPYVAMELVEGRPLLEYCDRHRLGLAARLRLLRKLAAAVGHAHQQLVVHRDIKSSNVLVDARGEPKLLDFGIAATLSGGAVSRRTATAERFLTPSNAAPEQILGAPVGVGCDIHGLGLLAYELLCGRPPFDLTGLRAGEIERLLLEVPAPLMSQRAGEAAAAVAHNRGLAHAGSLVRALRGDLDQVVARCLRKSPSERYPSVEQFDRDLRALLEGLPIAQRRSELGYRLRKFIGRHRLAVALASGLALTLLGATAIVARQAWSLAEQRNRVVVERDRAQFLVDLLKESFVAADPARVAGESVRVGDVLAALRPRLDALRDPQPELYANLAATMAEVELGLGMDRDAALLAERALAAIGGQATPELLRSLQLSRGVALTRIGDYPQASAALAEVTRIDPHAGPDLLVALGRLRARESAFAEAIVLLDEALRLLAARAPGDELATMARLERVQVLRHDAGPEVAIAAVDELLAWQAAVLAPEHPQLVRTRILRIELAIDRGDDALPLSEARELHAEILRNYGVDSPLVARSAGTLAWVLNLAGEHAEALELARTAADVWSRSLGRDHAQTVRGLYNLGLGLAQAPEGQEEALKTLAAAVAAAERRFGAGVDTTEFMRNGLARVQIRFRRWQEAIDTLAAESARQGLGQLAAGNRAARVALWQSLAEGPACSAGSRPADCEVIRSLLGEHAGVANTESATE